MRIRGVAFDVDGTLYSSSAAYLRASHLLLRHPVFLSRYRRVRREIRCLRPLEDIRKEQAGLLARYMRIPATQAAQLIESVVYTDWERCFRFVQPYAGLRQLLCKLKAMDLTLAVLSDFPVDGKLRHLGLSEIWDVRLCSEDCRYLKPNPEPFQRLLSLCDLAADAMLYVGNSYEYDVLGAHRIGMATAHLARRPQRNSVATFTFRSYWEFETRFFGLLGY